MEAEETKEKTIFDFLTEEEIEVLKEDVEHILRRISLNNYDRNLRADLLLKLKSYEKQNRTT